MGAQGKIYLKIDVHSLVTVEKVYLKDVAKLEGVEEELLRQIKEIELYEFEATTKKQMVVFSVLKVIELIHKNFPDLDIEPMGEEDFIIEYKGQKTDKVWLEKIKLAAICVITFFGAAFTIMAFNNDISINGVFERFYMQMVGNQKPQVTELEVCYSIGIALGILIFFNHIGRKKITPDPTPIQVELRKYENDINETFIVNASRKGHSEDVD
ncbi:MAG: stage V sporulation protein AA [Agathobacter sp.]